MQQALLDHLKIITEEEQRILDGMAEVDKGIYTSGQDFIVDSAKMLQEGKLIAVRTHTRFVHFPSHRHNFIEVLYVCEGAVTNIIGDKKVVIRKGELLFLNQFTRHEILPAGKDDIVINFMVLPEFFDVAYTCLLYTSVKFMRLWAKMVPENQHLSRLSRVYIKQKKAKCS